MLDFEMHLPTRLVFGRDSHKRVGALLKQYGFTNPLLVYGGQSIKKSGLYDAVRESLEAEGLSFSELGGVQPNPRVSLVREGIALARERGCDVMLAVGGGSTIDTSKAIAAGVFYDGDIWDLYSKRIPFSKALPVTAILTLPAAGSEMSSSAVISDEETQVKQNMSNNILRPLFSIMNPELFFTLPKNQIANGIADIMSHIFERYFTSTTQTDLIDGLSEATLRTILRHGPKVVENPSDYDAWCQVGFGGTIAHNDLLGLGRRQDWATHLIEHELSALYDVAHGAGLAALTPSWMTYVYKENINMFVQFAVNVMGVGGSFREPEAIVLEGIDRLRRFFSSLGLATTLSGIGIGPDRLEEMAKRVTGADGPNPHTIGGVKALDTQDVLEILKLAQ